MILSWVDYLNYDFPAPTNEERDKIEQEIKQTLPTDYWDLVKYHQGHIPKPNQVILQNAKATREMFGVLLYVVDSSRVTSKLVRGYSLLNAFDCMRNYYPTGIIPFADDTGGNYLAFDFRSSLEGAIVFVNHEIEGEKGLTLVASCFSKLIDSLVN